MKWLIDTETDAHAVPAMHSYANSMEQEGGAHSDVYARLASELRTMAGSSPRHDSHKVYGTRYRLWHVEEDGWYLADSAEDALAEAERQLGGSWAEEFGEDACVTLVAPETMIDIGFDWPGSGRRRITLSAAEWALIYESDAPTCIASHNW